MYWRRTWLRPEPYPLCKPIELPDGMLVSHQIMAPVRYIKSAIYKQVCYEGAYPMLNTNMGMVIDQFAAPLPVVHESWVDYTRDNVRGSFSYSVLAIVYAILVSFVVTWFLTIFVLTNYTIKPSYLLRTSTFLSSIYMLVVVVKSIVTLHTQQRDGYLHGPKLLDSINNSLAINIIDLIVVLLLQINQVQVIMRIFLRQKDKRMTFFIGVVASIASQVIWAVAKFHRFDKDDEAGEILPTFIYLVRIVIGLCYAVIISVFLLVKINYIVANKKIWLLLLLTFILIYSPVAFFIADVANSFVYELSEVFSVVTYVVCVVIPWEWCNKFNVIMKAKEKEGVLGRRFYEDELYELDRFELFVEEETEEENGATPDADDEESGNNVSRRQKNRSLDSSSDTEESPAIPKQARRESASAPPTVTPSGAKGLLRNFLALTDTIIAAGFAIPRSVSVSTQSSDRRPLNAHLNAMHTAFSHRDESDDEMDLGVQASNRRNLFVYSRKEVVVDFSEEE